MSFSRVIWGIINIFAPMVAAFIVANFGGIKAEGIRPLYYIQIGLSLFVFLFIAWKLQPLLRDNGKKKLTSGSNLFGVLRDFQDFFKGEKRLKRWMMLRITQQFGINLALPFTFLWLVNVKGASPYILGIMGTFSVFISLVLQIPAGRLADKIGRKKVYFLLRPFSFLGTALLILAPRPEYLIVVGILGALTISGGGVGGGLGEVSFIPFITMFWEMVPSEKRGRLFGIEGLMNIATVPATIIGGILWQQGFMAEVLFLPILLEVLVVMPILFTIPETLKPNK
jgi:MFS family permease